MTSELPRLVKVRKVAELLDVHRSTVNRMINDGELPAHRVGNGKGVLRVPETAVLAYLDRKATA